MNKYLKYIRKQGKSWHRFFPTKNTHAWKIQSLISKKILKKLPDLFYWKLFSRGRDFFSSKFFSQQSEKDKQTVIVNHCETQACILSVVSQHELHRKTTTYASILVKFFTTNKLYFFVPATKYLAAQLLLRL